MDRLLNVMTVTSLLLIVLVLTSLRRAHIRVEYSVTWLLAGIALLIVSRSRTIVDATSDFIGIPHSPLALLLIIGSVFLLMFFRFSIVLSRLRDDNIALAQRLAILEYHLRSLQDGSGSNS